MQEFTMKLDRSMMDYSDILESYLIPAEEGFLFTNIREENISKLGEKRMLLVFTTDNTLKYGGINPKRYSEEYKFSDIISFPLDSYIYYRIDSDKYKCPKMDLKIKTVLDKIENDAFSKDKKMVDLMAKVLSVCDEYSRTTNTLVVGYLSAIGTFCFSIMREYPIVITNASIVKSVLHHLSCSNSLTINQIANNYSAFKIVKNKIPKSLYVKDMKFDLYHISPNNNIKVLTPRITNKPLAKENVGVYRVSAAPSIDACFRAVGINIGDNEKSKTYYVYKLKLTKDMQIVKPSKELVPDQAYTNEYWILDPVPVDLIGSIIVSVDEKKNQLIFDTSNMSEDPMITTKWKSIPKD